MTAGSPEFNSIKPGDIVAVKNSHAGRVVGRAMYNTGQDVFVRATLKFNPTGRQVPLHEPFYLNVPIHYPGLRRMRPAQTSEQPAPQQQTLPDF